MSELRRYQLSRASGWQFPANTRKVDRSTRFGNPFRIGEHGDRNKVVTLFADLVERGMVTMTNPEHVEEQRAYLAMLKEHLPKLHGRCVACWCPTDKSCHGDVLMRAAARLSCNEVQP